MSSTSDERLKMIDEYLKGDYTVYIIDLIKEVKKRYKKYLKYKGTDKEILYAYVQKAIWDLTIEIKAEKVERTLSEQEGNKMKEDFWGMIYD